MRGNNRELAGGWIRYQEEEPGERVYWVPSIVPTRSSESGGFNRWARKCLRCGCGFKRVYSLTVAQPRPRPRRSFYRLGVGGVIREMSTPASLSWRRYGSNDVLNAVRAGPASALR